MFNLELRAGPEIDVSYRRHSFHYAVDGSAPNPLEAFYASLAGCAGVFAKKACAALGISDEGIAIDLRPVVRPGNPMIPERIVTTVCFPEHFDADTKAKILDSISYCAVKEVVRLGADIEFAVVEAA